MSKDGSVADRLESLAEELKEIEEDMSSEQALAIGKPVVLAQHNILFAVKNLHRTDLEEEGGVRP